MKHCPYCEGEISATAKKCMHCGEWIDDNKKEINVDDGKGKYGRNWFYRFFFVTLLLLSAFLLISPYGERGDRIPFFMLFLYCEIWLYTKSRKAFTLTDEGIEIGDNKYKYEDIEAVNVSYITCGVQVTIKGEVYSYENVKNYKKAYNYLKAMTSKNK